jgi:hypothetical protein
MKVGVTNGIVPESFIARAASAQAQLQLQGWGLLRYARPPDSRDWHINELVDAARPDGDRPGVVVIVGGSPEFQQSLLRFTSLTRGQDQSYVSFLFQLYPDLVADDLLRFVESAMPSMVLYKSPPYDPPFLGNYADDVVRALSDPTRYTRHDLSIVQPDGSRFALYVPRRPPIQVLERNFSGNRDPGPAAYVFSDRYALESVKFTVERFGMIASPTWRRLGTPAPNEHMFFHLVDGNGNLVAQFDRPMCNGCADRENVSRWTESVYLDKNRLGAGQRIGIGVYSPPDVATLKGSGGSSDWDGARALFELPRIDK